MRRLVTFVVRLWVDPDAQQPSWEGQVECVGSGERAHVCGTEELARFVDEHVVQREEWGKAQCTPEGAPRWIQRRRTER
ncbi:MAG TPA: hypothetical protein PKO09_10965 [Anaerolineae bacterium]|nr:hypothetical protein [Anaerolineae bacterium]HNS51687.1 hypothetical protein [Anaerolineae bacterium]